MPWIESHTVLIRHRKVNSLAKELRLKPVYVVGHLHALWHAALEQQEDGDLSSWSDDLIAELSAYPGDAPQYVSLLQKHGWLDGRLLHDWLDYAGRYLKSKYHTADPDRYEEIRAKHRSPKGHLKVAHLTNQPDLTKSVGPTAFSPPTVEEVKAYCTELGTSINPSSFVDFYASKGWMVGKNKMKDWRAAVRLWVRREKNFSPTQPSRKVVSTLTEYTPVDPKETEELLKMIAKTKEELGVS